MKRFFIITLFISIFFGCGVYILGYHGAREFKKGNELPLKENVVKNARKLKGTPYDPLMGKFGNIGADFGFIVCSDVPNIAYGLSGFSFEFAMKKNFNSNPSAYNTRNGNNPDNPFFHRRARNLYAYFKSRNKLKLASSQPSIGDLVFYTKSIYGKGYIAHVALVTDVSDTGYKLMESAPGTYLAKEVDCNSPINRGWILVGFGSVY